jgi:hypothetical protein
MVEVSLNEQELQMVISAFHVLTIKGTEARQVGLLLDKFHIALENLDSKNKKTEKSDKVK